MGDILLVDCPPVVVKQAGPVTNLPKSDTDFQQMNDRMLQQVNRIKFDGRNSNGETVQIVSDFLLRTVPGFNIPFHPTIRERSLHLCQDPMILNDNVMPVIRAMFKSCLVGFFSVLLEKFIDLFEMGVADININISALTMQRLKVIPGRPLSFQQNRFHTVCSQQRKQIENLFIEFFIVFFDLQHGGAPLKIQFPAGTQFVRQRPDAVQHDSEQGLALASLIQFFPIRMFIKSRRICSRSP